MEIKIINGIIVTATDTYRGEIGIAKGKIVTIGEKISEKAKQVIDAKGAYVLPGGIDVHTHLDMPFMGTSSSDDFMTGTIAAAHGGTTCIVDFAMQQKGKSLRETLEIWKTKARGRAVIDYGFHMAISDLNDDVLAEIPLLVTAGVTSVKVFLAYKGLLMLNDSSLFKIMKLSKKSGALVLVHAENGDIIDTLVEDLISKRMAGPKYHAISRPPEAEAEATARAISIAKMASAPIYIVHLSCREALAKVKEARNQGFPVFAETCPQYLILSDENYGKEGFNGAKYVISPPLRDKTNHSILWQGLLYRNLDLISTDHCPFNFKGQKDLGKVDFSKIPNGAPGIENRLCLIFHEGVNKKRIDINRFVDLVSTTPAKMFGLYPEKGTVAVGSDADIVVFNPDKEFKITAKTNHQRVDYTPYEGYKGKGVPEVVMARGEILIRKGAFWGTPGRGRYVPRKSFALARVNG